MYSVCTQILSHDGISRLLLLVHASLKRAAHPRHALRALGPLRALLDMLGVHVRLASTARYTLVILLQLLRVRSEKRRLTRFLLLQILSSSFVHSCMSLSYPVPCLCNTPLEDQHVCCFDQSPRVHRETAADL